MNQKYSVWIARLLIAAVTFFNLQAAILFLIAPSRFAAGFEMSGAVGEAMVRGMGLLFLMWNIPYLVALYDPLRYRVSLLEALAMQFIGVAGESILLISLPGEHPVIQQTVIRFIYFDGSGFVALLIAAILILSIKRR